MSLVGGEGPTVLLFIFIVFEMFLKLFAFSDMLALVESRGKQQLTATQLLLFDILESNGKDKIL